MGVNNTGSYLLIKESETGTVHKLSIPTIEDGGWGDVAGTVCAFSNTDPSSPAYPASFEVIPYGWETILDSYGFFNGSVDPRFFFIEGTIPPIDGINVKNAGFRVQTERQDYAPRWTATVNVGYFNSSDVWVSMGISHTAVYPANYVVSATRRGDASNTEGIIYNTIPASVSGAQPYPIAGIPSIAPVRYLRTYNTTSTDPIGTIFRVNAHAYDREYDSQITKFTQLWVIPNLQGTPGGAGGSSSKPGGGGGTIDTPEGDATSTQQPPSFGNSGESNFVSGVAGSGLVGIFVPTEAQLKSFTSFLWSENVITQIVKMVTNPLDPIVAFHYIPGLSKPIETEESELHYANIVFKIAEDPFKMNKAKSQYITHKCGSVTMPEYWGNALDYDPYTKVEIYLPYIGFCPLNVDDIMGATITVDYNIDILTGDCVAMVYSKRTSRTDHDPDVSSIIAQFSGSVVKNIPLMSEQSNLLAIAGAAAGAATAVGAVVAGGVGASAGGALGTAFSEKVATAAKAATMKPVTEAGKVAKKGAAEALKKAEGLRSDLRDAITSAPSSLAACTAAAVMGSKSQYGRSGALGGSTGFLGYQSAYLLWTRPIQSLPASYDAYEGYPSNVTLNLGNLKGFTKIESIRYDDFPGNLSELEMMDEALRQGVII